MLPVTQRTDTYRRALLHCIRLRHAALVMIGERSMIHNSHKIALRPECRGQPGRSRTTLTATVALSAILAVLPVHFDQDNIRLEAQIAWAGKSNGHANGHGGSANSGNGNSSNHAGDTKSSEG